MNRETPRTRDVEGTELSTAAGTTDLPETGPGRLSVPARVAQGSAIVFVILLGLLHALKSDLDPSWHFISEYAVGRHGWLMTAAFLSLAVGCVSLCLALRHQADGAWFRIGLALLLVSGIGLVIGAVYVTDPINTAPEAATTSGTLHNLGGALGIALPIGIGILTWRLRRSARWAAGRRVIDWAGLLAVAASVVAIGAIPLLLANNDGRFGPETPVGWFNRLEIVAAAAWIFVAAGHAGRLAMSVADTTESEPLGGTRSQ